MCLVVHQWALFCVGLGATYSQVLYLGTIVMLLS